MGASILKASQILMNTSIPKDPFAVFQLSDDVDDVKINKMAERLLLTGRQLEKLLRDDLPIRQLITSSANSHQDDNTDDGL